MFAPGDVVNGGRLGPLRTGPLLGEGGQGWVFEAVAADGARLALKWYKPKAAVPAQWEALEYLVDRGAPDPRFLWPLDLVRAPGGAGTFGYVMELRPEGFYSLANLLSGRRPDGTPLDIGPPIVVTACRQLARSFQRLHAEGLCYRDISLNNVFFSADTGDILVCDVDNVGIDDGTSRVLGTGYFMAPEIVRDRSRRTLPSTATDRHSLAVLLFFMLFGEHPLDGRRSDRGLRSEQHLLQHFGVEPLFVLDPDDDSNRPLAEDVTRAWERQYPLLLRRLFTSAFTAGLHDPASRVVESMWVRALRRLRDAMGTCPACGATVFVDAAQSQQQCWRCESALPPALALDLPGGPVVVSRHCELALGHLTRRQDDERVIGRGAVHPHDPRRVGLQNRSETAWQVTTAEGATHTVGPGQVVGLLPDVQLELPQGTIIVKVL